MTTIDDRIGNASRRRFLQGAGAGLLTFSIGGCEVEMTPGEAREQGVAYGVLTGEEVAALEALGEKLVPGSTAAGLAHYVDHQLAQPFAGQLLMIRYLGVEPPFDGFYRAGLAALGDGAPDPFFAFVVRADAVDVTYGTMDGFRDLGVPYMAHIEPPSRWGES